MKTKIPIEVSARHIHISQKDLEKLFGKNHKLKILHKISQPGQFAAQEEVEIINEEEKLKARIVGPCRKQTQAEISITDAHKLKLKKIPKIEVSGDLNNATSIIIKGPKARTKAKVIIPERHLHASEKQAKKLKIKDQQRIKIKIAGKRALIFENVIVRAGKEHSLAFQIDTDEANAAGIKSKGFGELIK